MTTSRVVGTFAADGQSNEIRSTGRPLFVSGQDTFGGGTISVQYKLEDGTFAAFAAGIVPTLAAVGEILVPDIPPNMILRLDLAGSAAPSLDFILQA